MSPSAGVCHLLLLVGLLSVPLDGAGGQTITLEGDVWAPHVMDPAYGSKGFMVDAAELALTRAGFPVTFKALPWTRALADTESGASAAVVGIYFSQASKRKYVVPTEELGISVNHLFVRSDSPWKYAGEDSLRGMVLATIADYDYGDLNSSIERAARDQSPQVQVMFGNDALEKKLRKLLTDQVTVLVEDPVVVSFVAKKMRISGLVKSVGVVAPANRAGIAFSPKDPGPPTTPELCRTGSGSFGSRGN